MSPAYKGIVAALVAYVAMFVLSSPASAQHHRGHHGHHRGHHGHHRGHHGHHGHHHGHHHHRSGFSVSFGYGYPGYGYGYSPYRYGYSPYGYGYSPYGYGYSPYSYSRYSYADYPPYRYISPRAIDDYYYRSTPAYVVAKQPVEVAKGVAHIEVLLPDPEATVWFQDHKTSKKGERRVFASTELQAGKTYAYTLRAAWNQGGRTVTDERKVVVAAGNRAIVDFTQTADGSPTKAPTDLPP